MAVRKFKPVTPGTRHKVISTFEEITTDTPEKSLLVTYKSTGGRNNQGRLTVRYQGGGHKRKLRIIDFKRDKEGIPGIVKTIEYDPNRTARIALVFYSDGEKRYMIAPTGLVVGQTVISGKGVPPEIGNTLELGEIPLGTLIHNIESKPGRGAAIARSAGNHAQLMSRDGRFAVVKMPSGETRMLLVNCKATVGAVSNSDHGIEVDGKAGRARWNGWRPRNRGVAMNPVDHPMGGGEGKGSGGIPRSRNGIPCKGYKTRRKKNPTSKLILERRKK